MAEDFNAQAFAINLFLTIIFSSALGFLFQKYSLSFSDRRRMASTFVLLSVATMCVISVVKVSLALSLGLVGALSIVRFRTAIKDPEELVFLFLSIVIGIAHGANQSVIGAAVFVVSAALVLLRYVAFNRMPVRSRYSHIVLSGAVGADEIMSNVEAIMENRTVKSELRRVDSSDGHTEVILDVVLDDSAPLRETIQAFEAQGLSVTYIASGSD
jgi:hypothetical protein